MEASDLKMLGNDALVDLGAQLEIDLATAESMLLTLADAFRAERKPLFKPGLKLAVNAAVGIAGISLAPVTMGWSLALTVIGGR